MLTDFLHGEFVVSIPKIGYAFAIDHADSEAMNNNFEISSVWNMDFVWFLCHGETPFTFYLVFSKSIVLIEPTIISSTSHKLILLLHLNVHLSIVLILLSNYVLKHEFLKCGNVVEFRHNSYLFLYQSF